MLAIANSGHEQVIALEVCEAGGAKFVAHPHRDFEAR